MIIMHNLHIIFSLSSMEDNTEFKIGYYIGFNSKSLANASPHS